MSRSPLVWVVLVFLLLLPGCVRDDPEATVPMQDSAEARKLLVGRWEGDQSGEPMGFDFKESGEAIYLTRELQWRRSWDGKPVRHTGTYSVPRDNHLQVDYSIENGWTGMGFWFTVSRDEITFYKYGDRTIEKVAGMRRVKEFSSDLTGK